MLTLETNTDFARCERAIASVAGPNRDEYITLDLATNISLSNRPAGTAAIIQSIVSWARNFDAPKLLTHAVSLKRDQYIQNSEETIRNLLSKPHGLVAAMLASDLLAVDRIESVRFFAYQFAKSRAESMNDDNLQKIEKGQATTLICIDHSSMGYLSHFYHQADVKPRLKGEKDFVLLARNILDASLVESYRRDISSSDENAIGVILRELISNTHDHARSDASGRPYKRSVRGLYSRFHYLSPDIIEAATAGLPALQTFISANRGRWRGKNLQFAELSVFDSGPGFAASITRGEIDPKKISLAKELELVQSCFLKHVTSKNKNVYGAGLHRLEGMLRRKEGFLRLRTGRLDIYKAFPPERPDSAPHDGILPLLDTYTETDQLTAVAAANGVTITIILPIGVRGS